MLTWSSSGIALKDGRTGAWSERLFRQYILGENNLGTNRDRRDCSGAQ
jgi:hypothetical protein